MVRGTDKRERIFAAAVKLFAERGFHGTSVPDLAREAGVGAGTIYRYFESKEALVNELYRHHKQRLTAHLLDDFPLDAPWREQLGVLWRRLVDYARRHPTELAFLELLHHAPYLDPSSRAMEEAGSLLIRSRLDAARAAGAIKDIDGDVLHALVYGGFIGLVREARAGKLQLTDEVVEATEQCVWEAIRR